MSNMYQKGKSPAVGLRFEYQMFPQAASGGLSYYPLSGVVNGFKLAAAPTVSGDNISISITAGDARLDSYPVSFAGVTNMVIPSGLTLSSPAEQTVEIYLNPLRKIPALLTLPGSPADKDQVILVSNVGDYQIINEYKQYSTAASAWLDFDPVKAPPGAGHNNLPLNGVRPVVDTATSSNKSFSATAEKIVYHATKYPPYVNSPSMAYLRQSAALLVAQVTVASGAVVNYTGYGVENTLLV